MATSCSRSLGDNILEALTDKITCQMCLKVYTEPKLLSCQHYYCKGCLLEKAQLGGDIVCLKCGQQFSLGAEEITQLPEGLLAAEAKDLHKIMSRSNSTSSISCELCNSLSDSHAEAYCHHCSKYLCSFCEEVHRRLKSYTEHAVLKLNSSDIIESSSDDTQSTPCANVMVCTDHNKPNEAYCFDCNKLTCQECVLTEHIEHQTESVETASLSVLSDLKAKIAPLQNSHSQHKEHQASLESLLHKAEKSGEEASNFVNKSFDIVLQQFEKYRVNLLQSIRNEINHESRELQVKIRKQEARVKQIESLLNAIQQGMERASKEQLLSSHQRFIQQATEYQQLPDKSTGDDRKSHENSFNIYKTSCARIIGAIGDSLKCADPIMCSVEGDGAKKAEVHGKAMFVVRACQSNEAPCTAIQNVQVEMSSIDECKSCETNVKITNGSTYEVSYTPTVQGQHILKVRVNGRPIVGNPFQVLVKRPLLHAREPVLIIRGVKKLHDLAIHRNGNLLATQYETGKVVSIDKRGKSMKTLLSGLGRPFGVTADRHGCVYVSRNKKCCLQKFSRHSEPVSTAGCREGTLGNFNKPGRMVLNTKGELFICDTKNSRVQVFDDDLEYLRWYSISKPTGIAIDKEGDLYVTEGTKNTLCKIHISTNMGMAVIRTGLKNPQGVYVDDDYIYVCERDPALGSAHVAVLDHEGEYMTALGGGVLAEPGGVVGDEDGYLYVCDEKLEAICVF